MVQQLTVYTHSKCLEKELSKITQCNRIRGKEPLGYKFSHGLTSTTKPTIWWHFHPRVYFKGCFISMKHCGSPLFKITKLVPWRVDEQLLKYKYFLLSLDTVDTIKIVSISFSYKVAWCFSITVKLLILAADTLSCIFGSRS